MDFCRAIAAAVIGDPQRVKFFDVGRDATLIGASANIVSGDICAAHGEPLRFLVFLRYGVPITVAQLTVAAAYVLALQYLI